METISNILPLMVDASLREERSSRNHSVCPPLKTLQDVRNQSARKILRETTESGRVLFKEAGEVLRDFVLFAKNVRRILVEHLAIAVGQRNFDAHRDQGAGSATGSGV